MFRFRFSYMLLLLMLVGCAENDEAIAPETLDQWTFLTTENGLADNFVVNIYEDKSGTMWFSHDGAGVTSFDGVNYQVFNTGNALISDQVVCVLEDKDNDLLVGTRGGLSYRHEDQWYYINQLVGVPIYSMFEDQDGVLWLGTGGYGIVYNEGNGFYQLFDPDCDDCNFVNDIDQASDGELWFATNGGVKRLWDGDFTLFTTDDGLSDNVAYTLHEDTWGDLWIGSINGGSATRYHDDSFEKISLANSTPVSWVTSIQDYKNGELWIGTLGYGLLHYNGSVMRRIFNELPNESITTVFRDSKGNMWVGMFSNGVGKYTPR